MFSKLIEKAKEPSTWRGLILVATAAGAHWSPESQNLVVTLGVSLAGLVEIIRKEIKK